MSKVIAIIDKPKNCEECIFGVCKYRLPLSLQTKGYYCQLKDPKCRVIEDFNINAEVHLSNCPLKELPNKKKDTSMTNYKRYVQGWNDCIDRILEGSEEDE